MSTIDRTRPPRHRSQPQPTKRTARVSPKKQLRRDVHMISMTDPLGDIQILIRASAPWISRAVESLPAYGRNYSKELGCWIVKPQLGELLSDVIEEEAGHDSPWCDDCIAWIEDHDQDLCDVWSSRSVSMAEDFGFLIAMVDEEEEMPRVAAAGFRVPESVKKLFSDPNTVTHQAAKMFAKEGLKRAVNAMGIPVRNEVVDEMFEAFYASAYQSYEEWKPRGDTTMSPQQAAQILGCAWPCTHDVVKAAYRKKVLDTHPDREGGSKEAFIRVGMAYETLCDAGGWQK